jgi:hypothetical protein
MNEIKKIAISAGIGFIIGIIIMLAVFFSIRGNYTREINELKNNLSESKSRITKAQEITEQQRKTIDELEGTIKREREINQAERTAYNKLTATNTGIRGGVANIEKLNSRGAEILEEIEKLIQERHD